MRYVKYVGLSQQRMITAQDWRSVGIQADTAVWSAFNGFAVPLDQFTDDQVAKAFANDPSFVVTGEGSEDSGEEFKPQPQNRDMTPSQFAQAVETPVDVVEYLGGDSEPSQSGSGATPGGGSAAPTSVATGSGGGSDAPGTTAH